MEDYLADPPAVGNAPWYNTTLPEEFIPPHLKTLTDEEATARQRGIAAANLAFMARQMAEFEESRAAARELMNRYVMPHLHFTKSVESTNACSWRQTVLTAANTYKSLGDHDTNRQCLDLIAKAAERSDDQDMVLYLLAFDAVRQENYTEAIATLAKIPTESKWANSREKLTKLWLQKQAEKEISAQAGTAP